MRKRIIIAVINDLVTDQRVHKVATSLQREVGDVLLVGRIQKDSVSIDREYETERMCLLFSKGPLFYLEYNIRLLLLLLFRKTDIIVANDLDTLLACYTASKLKMTSLVYDSHEYFTEVPELISRPKVRSVWLKLEGLLLPRIKHCYTICHSIADIYRQKYDVPMKVVRNVPFATKSSFVNRSPKPSVIIYQGAINIGRGIEELILAMPYVYDAELWIYGSGDIEEDIKRLIEDEKLHAKVKFRGRIPFEQLHAETLRATLGICTEKGKEMGESYYYALPNKLFDYIQAGVPVLVNDLPEKRRIIDSYKVGFVLKDETPKAYAKQLNEILSSDLNALSDSLTRASKELCWENEERELLKVYRAID